MRIVRIAALAALLPLSLTAQSITTSWREMLSALPDPGGLPRVSIQFGDPALARALDLSAVPGAATDPAVLSLRGVPVGPLAIALLHRRGSAPTAAGFAVTQIARMLTLRAIPDEASILDLTPGAGAAIGPALAAMGYEERTERGVTAWAMGTEGRSGRRAERHRDDPFRAGLAGFPRVVIDGDRLRHADGSGLMFALVRGVGASIHARPDIAALADALDAQPPAGGLVQAVLYPDMAVLRPAAPADLLPGLPATAAWRSMVLADLTTGAQSTGVLALAVALPDMASAQALADRIVGAWTEVPIRTRAPRTLADATGGPPEVHVHAAGAGLWVLVLHQTRATVAGRSGHTHNPTFATLMAAISRDGVALLRP